MDRLAEIEAFLEMTGSVNPDQAEWLVAEVNRLREQVKQLQIPPPI